MGWATGCEIAQDLWTKLKPQLSEDQFKQVTYVIYRTFSDWDADAFDFELDEDCFYYQYLKYNEPNEFLKMVEEWKDV